MDLGAVAALGMIGAVMMGAHWLDCQTGKLSGSAKVRRAASEARALMAREGGR